MVNPQLANPYVGPQPFRKGDPLYGRDREISELRHFLLAERIVLLYSPSGAGKSSLIQAGLIPKLADHFEIWGPTRVAQLPPADLSVTNRYTWSALDGFEQVLRQDKENGLQDSRILRVPGSLASMTLQDYFSERKDKKNALLIFDQFEEILRVDPDGVEAKRAFFDQLGVVLYDPRIWALFVLREDYLAPFDPYARQVPTHLLNRYRIDRLNREAAKLAIEKPTSGGERKFAPGVVDMLVENLAKVNVQQLDGSVTKPSPRQARVVDGDGLADLAAHFEDRVEGGQRVLEHHGDPPAPQLAHLLLGKLEEVLTLEEDLAADLGRRRQQSEDGHRGDALAGA